MRRYTGSANSARQGGPAAPQVASDSRTGPVDSPAGEPSWRDTAFLPLQKAGHVLGISVASLYRLEQEGTLKFRRLAGRTLVRTEGVIALADADAPWAPQSAGAAARAKRAELAANGWKEVAA